MLGHQSFNSLLAGCHFDPPHRAATARTMGNLFEKHMFKQPGPGLSVRRWLVGVGGRLEQLPLVTRGRRLHRVFKLRRLRGHGASEFRVRRQHTVVPQHMKSWWRYCGQQPCYQVEGLEDEEH